MGGFAQPIGTAAGGTGGLLLGGPPGAAIGAQAGGQIGGALQNDPVGPGQIAPQPQPQGQQQQPQQQIGEQELITLLLFLSQIAGQQPGAQ